MAQLHQARPLHRTNPTATKAIIIAGASHDLLKDSNSDSQVSENAYLKNKSGAGLVNAIKSIEIAEDYNYTSAQFHVGANVTSMPDIDPCGSLYVPAGKKVRLVMTFNKIDDAEVPTTGLTDNVNFAVYNNNTDALVAWSSAVYNNVEIIEFTANQSASYYLVASLPNYIPRSTGVYLHLSFAWMIVN